MKNLLLFSSIIVSLNCHANDAYIGDFESIDEQSHFYGHTPKNILKVIKENEYDKYDRIFLSTGVSNDCGQYNIIKSQIAELSKYRKNIVILKNRSCMGVDSLIRSECNKVKYCTYKEIHEIQIKENEID